LPSSVTTTVSSGTVEAPRIAPTKVSTTASCSRSAAAVRLKIQSNASCSARAAPPGLGGVRKIAPGRNGALTKNAPLASNDHHDGGGGERGAGRHAGASVRRRARAAASSTRAESRNHQRGQET